MADAFGGKDPRLRIETFDGGRPEGRSRAQQYMVSLRVGSNGRAPVWTRFVAALHRPLPPGGRIKWAWLQRDQIAGPRCNKWSLHLTVDGEAAQDQKLVSDRSGVVAIDLGWRARPDGFRVAYWLDDSGRHDEIVLPEVTFEHLAWAREYGAIRDRLFNGFRDRLAGWIDGAVALPGWLAREVGTLRQWRSADRLSRLALE